MRNARWVATAWLAGTGASLLLAFVLIGCCALPFHGLVHQWVPCHMAQAVLAAHEDGAGGDHDPPASPAPQKRDAPTPELRLAGRGEPRSTVATALLSPPLARLAGPISHRSQLALGAMRCDDDVGLRLALLDTLRI